MYTQQIRRVITVRDRPWARAPHYNHFLGGYRLQSQTGVLFAEDTPNEQITQIATQILRLPAQLQDIARAFDVTFSSCAGKTRAGHDSTCYGDFGCSTPSPHVEVGSYSLSSSQLLLAHLAHELGHVWWSTRTRSAQQEYSRWLAASSHPDLQEVTAYSQDLFERWLQSLDAQHNIMTPQRHDYLTAWAMESFCETLATIVEPQYPHRNSRCSADLGHRKLMIKQFMELSL